MTYYAALDVSLRSVNICVIDDEGEIKAETKLDSEVTDIVAYLDKLDLQVSSIGLVSDAQQDRQERCQRHRPTVTIRLVQSGACFQ